ncbi:MAG: hypothetical protein ACFFFG_14865 [Candidatus Thorarchaeota archaeon]
MNHLQRVKVSFFVNLLVHLVVGLLYFNPVDFVLQFEAAKEISRGKLLYRDIGAIVLEGKRLPRPQYPPLYLYTLAALMGIVGVENVTWQGVKIFLIICNLINGVLLYLLVSKITENIPQSRTVSLLAMNWFLLNPATLGVVFGGYHEGFMLIFVLMAFIAILNDNYILGGVGFGLALLTKPTAGIYMLPLLVWGIRARKWQVLWTWGIAGALFLMVSFPFLILAPSQYIEDVFLIHATRPDPSMSLYTYFFTEFSTTLLPFLIQFTLLTICLMYLVIRSPVISQRWILETVVPLMTIFLMFNRILYPHYIPFFFAFYSIMLVLRIKKDKETEIALWSDYALLGLVGGLTMVYIGEIWWSLLWSIEAYSKITENPFFAISALLCILGLGILAVSSIRALTDDSPNREIRSAEASSV